MPFLHAPLAAPVLHAVSALCLTIAPPAGQAPDRPAVAPVAVVWTSADATVLSPEVRLRKLHIVRPDLIPFPLARETYC